MGWQDREYAQDDYGGSQYGGGSARPAGGSWLAGLPSPGKGVKWLLILNFGMFLWAWATGKILSPVFIFTAMFYDNAVFEGQIWRVLTYMYMHDPFDVKHVLFNMFGLYMIGAFLETNWGTKRFLIFYHLAGLVSVALYMVLAGLGVIDKGLPLVGASGAVFGILAACAVCYPQITIIFFLFPIPIRAATLIFFVIAVFGILNDVNAGGEACHLGGMAFGLVWGYRGHRVWKWLEDRDSRKKESQWRANREKAQQLQDQVDAILEKVKRDGINSLSNREKKMLEQATKQQNSADRYHRVG